MKIPKRLQPLVDEGMIDSVVRQLMRNALTISPRPHFDGSDRLFDLES
jgi:hypothetical protein